MLHEQSTPLIVLLFVGAEFKNKGVVNPFPGSFPILLLFQEEFCPRLTDLVNPALPEVADFVMDVIWNFTPVRTTTSALYILFHNAYAYHLPYIKAAS